MHLFFSQTIENNKYIVVNSARIVFQPLKSELTEIQRALWAWFKAQKFIWFYLIFCQNVSITSRIQKLRLARYSL